MTITLDQAINELLALQKNHYRRLDNENIDPEYVKKKLSYAINRLKNLDENDDPFQNHNNLGDDSDDDDFGTGFDYNRKKQKIVDFALGYFQHDKTPIKSKYDIFKIVSNNKAQFCLYSKALETITNDISSLVELYKTPNLTIQEQKELNFLIADRLLSGKATDNELKALEQHIITDQNLFADIVSNIVSYDKENAPTYLKDFINNGYKPIKTPDHQTASLIRFLQKNSDIWANNATGFGPYNSIAAKNAIYANIDWDKIHDKGTKSKIRGILCFYNVLNLNSHSDIGDIEFMFDREKNNPDFMLNAIEQVGNTIIAAPVEKKNLEILLNKIGQYKIKNQDDFYKIFNNMTNITTKEHLPQLTKYLLYISFTSLSEDSSSKKNNIVMQLQDSIIHGTKIDRNSSLGKTLKALERAMRTPEQQEQCFRLLKLVPFLNKIKIARRIVNRNVKEANKLVTDLSENNPISDAVNKYRQQHEYKKNTNKHLNL